MTKEQYEMWISLPETQEVIKKINQKISDIAENYLNGGTLNRESPTATGMKNAEDVGQRLGLTFILDESELVD